MKTLITRTVTGIGYISLMGFAFLYSKWALFVIFLLFLMVALFEYFNLVKDFPETKNSKQLIIRHIILPFVWIIVPMVLVVYWCVVLNATPIMVALFLILCTNDTLAYLFGTLCGKHKIWKRVSPKKSWEGFLGGLLFTVTATWTLIYVSYFQNDTFTSPYLWMGFSLVVIIAGTFGDFAESMVKRLAQQKDSGSILPGHGGILDRIDSMLFAVPVGMIYWAIFTV